MSANIHSSYYVTKFFCDVEGSLFKSNFFLFLPQYIKEKMSVSTHLFFFSFHPEGRACAVVFDCKFIETSAALHHNVKDLFEGIVRQIRLRKDSKEDNARRMANTKRRESIGKKAKRFLGRIVAKNNKKMAFKAKSKSCHDLSVL